MKRASTQSLQRPLPRLERLLLDADVNAYLEQYLVVVGFDVVFAASVSVDIHDDTAILKWARRHRRIMVCHDKFKDGQTRIKIYNEIYKNGGRVIRIGGKPSQDPLTSLGKILVHRKDWGKFFEQNDGMVLVHGTGMKPMPRAYLRRQIKGELMDTMVALKRPRRSRQSQRRQRPVPPEQQPLNL